MFLVLILSAVVGAVMMIINVSSDFAAESFNDSMLNMSCRAVLSEFDQDLKNDYGIFAYCETDIEGKIMHYLNYSIEDRNRFDEIQSVMAHKNGYSMNDITCLKKSIIEYVKYLKAEKLLENKKTENEIMKNEKTNDKADTNHKTDVSERILRNQKIIRSLPSREAGKTGGSAENLKTLFKNGFPSEKEFITANTDNVLENEYIMNEFNNYFNKDVIKHETFFSNEVEYILGGKCSDKENRKAVRLKIIEAREAANIISIFKDKKMRTEVSLLAETISPGPGALLLEAAIASVWALAESENDMALLEHGQKVKTIKDSYSWAVDLESAWNDTVNKTGKGYIDTGVNEGLSYEDYLRLLLYVENESDKLLRAMDLIQINMKGNYNKSFLMKDHYCGFTLEAEINNKNFRYEHTY